MHRSFKSMGRAAASFAGVVLAASAAAAPAPEAGAGAPRIVVVGEVSGAANAVTGLLRQLQVVDEGGHWSGGNAVLVQTGDLVDRGEHVRDALDLFIRLQEEAAAAGGRVVVLMGNHELLNILGEFQGVDYAAYQHFAGPDAELQQQRAWEAVADWRRRRAEATDAELSVDEAARAEWLAAHPPGWVEYAMSMRSEGTYGRWLRTLPAAFELDGQLFVHAGFSPEMRGLAVAEVNRRAADEIATFDAYRARMAADGLGLPFSSARELVDVIAKEIAYLNGLDGARQRRAKGRLEVANELQPLTAVLQGRHRLGRLRPRRRDGGDPRRRRRAADDRRPRLGPRQTHPHPLRRPRGHRLDRAVRRPVGCQQAGGAGDRRRSDLRRHPELAGAAARRRLISGQVRKTGKSSRGPRRRPRP